MMLHDLFSRRISETVEKLIVQVGDVAMFTGRHASQEP